MTTQSLWRLIESRDLDALAEELHNETREIIRRQVTILDPMTGQQIPISEEALDEIIKAHNRMNREEGGFSND